MNYALPPTVTAALTGKLIFITGSEGFLGRHLTAALREIGASVVGFDIRNGPGEDVSNMKMLDEKSALFEAADYVIHAAGIASPYHYRRLPLVALDAATKGTRNLLELALTMPKCPKVLYLSSSEVYGNPAIVPTPESYIGALDPLSPRACYDVSKALGETLVKIYADQGVRATMVRLFNAYGPGMAEDDRRFMPQLRRAKLTGEPMRVYGSGTQTRAFCFVSDTVRGCLQALVFGGKARVYNIGNATSELTMPEVCRLAGVHLEVVPYPKEWPAEEPMRRCPDISRSREELEYRPLVSMEEGLSEFLP